MGETETPSPAAGRGPAARPGGAGQLSCAAGLPAPPPATQNVAVAVHVRPLLPHEGGGPPSVSVLPGGPTAGVQAGGQAFTVDAAYQSSPTDDPRPALYETLVAPLVAGLFDGVNATVFAYGATGAGKTWTMGTAWDGGNGEGVIPRAVAGVFSTAARVVSDGTGGKKAAVSVRASFIEIHNDDVRDLLLGAPPASTSTPTPPPASSSSTVTIRGGRGGVSLSGAVEAPVASAQELAALLAAAGARRATQATALNAASSRSHAVVTLTVEVARGGAGGGGGDTPSLSAKLNLVDLAGSERAKRTLTGGARLREAAHINASLLALGNVITALQHQQATAAAGAGGGGGGGGVGRSASGRLSDGGDATATTTTTVQTHIPYRASKLTRLLSDALGGTARALMVACVSPAPGDAAEARATLRWAARARSIRNAPAVQHAGGGEAASPAEVARLRAALAAARADAAALRAALEESGRAQQPPPPPPLPPPSPSPDTPSPALRARIGELEAAVAAATAREAARAAAAATRREAQRSRSAAAAARGAAAARAAEKRLAALAARVEGGGGWAVGSLPAVPGGAAAWVEAEAEPAAAAAELGAAATTARAALEAADADLDGAASADAVEAAVRALEAAEAGAARADRVAAAARAAADAAAAQRRAVLQGADVATLMALVEAALEVVGQKAAASLPPAIHQPSPADVTPAPSPAAAWCAEQADAAAARAAAIRARTAARGGSAPSTTTATATPASARPRSHPLAPDSPPGRLVFGALDNAGPAPTPLGCKLVRLGLEEEEAGLLSPVL